MHPASTPAAPPQVYSDSPKTDSPTLANPVRVFRQISHTKAPDRKDQTNMPHYRGRAPEPTEVAAAKAERVARERHASLAGR